MKDQDPSQPMEPEDLAKTICFCHNVSLGKLRDAIRAGAVTLEQIQGATCASTGCGGCEGDVCEVLAQMLKT